MRRVIIFIILFNLLICGELPAKEKLIYKDMRPQKVLKATGKAAMVKEKKYFYSPEGKPDPFFPFVLLGKKSLKELKMQPGTDHYTKMLALLEELRRPKTELQRFNLQDITVTAIIKKGNKVMAMVRGPDKPIGYMVKEGTYIGKNGGVVEKIISEERNTEMGKQLIRKIIVKEPYLDQDGKIKYKRIELNMP